MIRLGQGINHKHLNMGSSREENDVFEQRGMSADRHWQNPEAKGLTTVTRDNVQQDQFKTQDVVPTTVSAPKHSS